MAKKRKRHGHPAGKPKAPRQKLGEGLHVHASKELDRVAAEVTGGGSIEERRVIAAIKLASCDARNRQLSGASPLPFCGCGAVALSGGGMACKGMPSDDEVRDILSGKAARGDAAPIR